MSRSLRADLRIAQLGERKTPGLTDGQYWRAQSLSHRELRVCERSSGIAHHERLLLAMGEPPEVAVEAAGWGGASRVGRRVRRLSAADRGVELRGPPVLVRVLCREQEHMQDRQTNVAVQGSCGCKANSSRGTWTTGSRYSRRSWAWPACTSPPTRRHRIQRCAAWFCPGRNSPLPSASSAGQPDAVGAAPHGWIKAVWDSCHAAWSRHTIMIVNGAVHHRRK